MPKKNHKESRSLLVKECKKLYQKEFIRWCKLTAGINKLLKDASCIKNRYSEIGKSVDNQCDDVKFHCDVMVT